MKIFGLNITRDAPPRADPAAEARSSPENPKYSLSDPAILDAIGGAGGAGGVVTPQRAVGTSGVFRAVSLIAQTVAQLPLHVYEMKDGKPGRVTEMPLAHLLHSEPNRFQTSYVFREAGQAQACLWGNFYSELQHDDRTGEVIGIYPLASPNVQTEMVGLNKVHRAGGIDLLDREVLHIPALGWDGIKGLSPIQLERITIGMSLAAEEFGAKFFENGTRLSGAIEHPSKLSPEAAGNLRASWTEIYAGKANAGRVAILEEGMKFNPLTMPLSDAQFIELRKFQISDIARIFGIPPHKLYDLERATFSNIEHQSIEFVIDSIMPWLIRWEQEINRKCFTSTQKGRFFVKFNVAGLLRGDIKTRYEAYNIGRNGGWLSVNDIRRTEDMPTIDNGDTYLEPLNMKPAGTSDPDKGTKE